MHIDLVNERFRTNVNKANTLYFDRIDEVAIIGKGLKWPQANGRRWRYRSQLATLWNGTTFTPLTRSPHHCIIAFRSARYSTRLHRVVIPFATSLAEWIPPVAVRLRRDFGQLLALIRTHAILHQASRERDAERRIVATLDDYAVVRELVLDVISQGIEAAVAPIVRETVETVRALIAAGKTEVSLREIADALRPNKSAASRRITSAVQGGYLRNPEDRKRRPARLCLGEAMPEESPVLPPDEMLRR